MVKTPAKQAVFFIRRFYHDYQNDDKICPYGSFDLCACTCIHFPFFPGTDLSGKSHGDVCRDDPGKQGRKLICLHLSSLRRCGSSGFCCFSGGLSDLFGVTGGFLLGYLPLPFFSGCFYEKRRDGISLLIGTISGNFVLYAFGTAWFMVYLRADLFKALSACVIPFLPGDLFKIVVVNLLTPRIKAALKL